MSTETRYFFGERAADYLDRESYSRAQVGTWGSNPAIVAAVECGDKVLWEVPPHEPRWRAPRASMVSDGLPAGGASVCEREPPPARPLRPAEAIAILRGA